MPSEGEKTEWEIIIAIQKFYLFFIQLEEIKVCNSKG